MSFKKRLLILKELKNIDLEKLCNF